MDDYDIILGTQVSVHIDLSTIDLVGVLLVEAELGVARYDIEEHIYHHISYASRHATDVMLQTLSSDLPLIHDLQSGNYRSFFRRTLDERKKFGYPPYNEMVTIWILQRDKARVQSL